MHRILSALPSNDWEGSKGLPVPLSACVFKTLIHGSGYRQRGLYGCHHWGGKTNKGILIPKVFLPFRSRGRNRRGEGISLFLRSRLKSSWSEAIEVASFALMWHGVFPAPLALVSELGIWMGVKEVLTTPQVKRFWCPIGVPLSWCHFNFCPTFPHISKSKDPLSGN